MPCALPIVLHNERLTVSPFEKKGGALMRNLRLRDVKPLAQGHTAGKAGFEGGLSDSKDPFFTGALELGDCA